MREEEKIFAGKLFNNQCAELRAIKRKSHAANQRYNRLDETDPERDEIIRSMLGRVGETFHLVGPIHFNYGTHTFIGENFFANFILPSWTMPGFLLATMSVSGPTCPCWPPTTP